jgi:hypothetical protein
MTATRIALAALIAALVAGPPAEAQTRRETIAGWRLETGGTGDGGHMVRLVRRGRDYRLEHYLEFWRGNGGVVVNGAFQRGGCRSGEAGGIVPFEQGMARATLDLRLADYLRQCPLSPAKTAMLRRTLEAVWPRFAARAAQALAAIEAENEAIVSHGEQR